jgi:hypothetical protein
MHLAVERGVPLEERRTVTGAAILLWHWETLSWSAIVAHASTRRFGFLGFACIAGRPTSPQPFVPGPEASEALQAVGPVS